MKSPPRFHRHLLGRVFLLLLCSMPGVEARLVRFWSPDELAAKAQIICNGIPVKVTVTDQKSQIPESGNNSLPVRIVVATIKVLSTFKGKVGSEIELRFPALDFSALPGHVILDGPEQIDLTVGQRYRFFLNPAADHSWYVSALEGNQDDRSAVEPLDLHESDTNPPLFKDEATRLATDYLLQHHPFFGSDFKWVIPTFDSLVASPHWNVEFYPNGLRYPAFTYGALVVVDANRSIDSDSYISTAPPASTPDPNMLNMPVIVNWWQHSPSSVTISRGVLEKIADQSITLHFTKPDPAIKADRVDIPTTQIEGILVLQK